MMDARAECFIQPFVFMPLDLNVVRSRYVLLPFRCTFFLPFR